MKASPRSKSPSMAIHAWGKLAVLTVAVAVLVSLTGCVQSVYPWHVDEDVVFDANLAGAWSGEGDTQGCLLNITADPARQARHYNVEIIKDTSHGCGDLSEPGKWTAGGQLLEIGRQRFVEIWDDKCDLYTLLKLNADSQTMSLVPLDSEVVAGFIHTKKERLQGRVDGHTMQPDDVLLTSPTPDLRRFLQSHANDENVFPAEVTVKFHRK